jgi:hypothetical protein
MKTIFRTIFTHMSFRNPHTLMEKGEPMKALILYASILLSFVQAQEISKYLIGSNAWMSQDTYYGEMERLWPQMQTAKYQVIRLGGHGSLSQNKNLAWLYRTIDSVRRIGAEPLVQVPSDYTEQQATQYIRSINVDNGKNIRYWSIGNEPDWQRAGGGNDPQGVDLTPAGVANYTRAIAKGLRAVNPDIIIFAGEFAWYNVEYLNALLGTGTSGITGKDSEGRYYINGISWHHYDANSPNRSVEMEVDDLRTRFTTVNARRPDSPLLWMIGEYNSNVGNDGVTTDMKAWSFQTGQNFAITFDVGMRKNAFTICPWSMHESGGARTNYDLGLFDGSNGNYTGRASYYHALMLGQNWKATSLARNDNQTDVTVVAMGDTGGVAVMILNRNKTQAFPYQVSLSSSTPPSGTGLLVGVNAQLQKTLSGNIPAYTTLMLVTDKQGNLIKRYTYGSGHADRRVGPDIETFTPEPTGIVKMPESPALPLPGKRYLLNGSLELQK